LGSSTIDSLFRSAVARNKDRLAVVDAPNRAELMAGQPAALTYSELDRLVSRFARTLAEAGVGRDSIVVVQLPNVVELLAICLACARLGAVISPLPVQFRSHEIRQILETLRPVDAVVTATQIRREQQLAIWIEVLRGEPATRLLCFGRSGQLEQMPGAVRPMDNGIVGLETDAPGVSADDVYSICWTSGTVAAPKGVPRTHNNWILYARMVSEACDVKEGDRILSPFPIVNLSGLGVSLLVWLYKAGTVHLHHPFSADLFLEQLARERIEFAVAPPAVLNMLLDQPRRADFGSLRTVMSGSSGLSAWMIGEYRRRHGIEIINGFGSNEGTTLTSSARDVPDAGRRAEVFPRIGGKGFRPRLNYHAWVRTKLVDPTDSREILEPGVPGELLVRSGAVFPGYFRRPDLNAGAFDEEGYFRTGDLFMIETDDDGAPEFYRFVGRLKSLIVRGGVKIAPEELTLLMETHPDIAEADALGYPDAVLGERICACVVLRPGASLQPAELVAFLRAKGIAQYKLPERVAYLNALPRNPIGKVAREALQKQMEAWFAQARPV
jgi:acyl-CoA synthetase (AMP-forming)/AMP-acid ligase II